MAYRIAGIDVHKRMLAVVVADVEVEGEYEFERQLFAATPQQLRSLAEWLLEREVEEAVMESTAQYWKPVWAALEQYWKPPCRKKDGAGRMSGALHLAQARSNRGRRGRKRDFPDAERLVKRLVAQELNLSFVPDAEQRLWRTVTRRKYQLTRNRARLQNQLESLLEEAHIKLSSLVSDLLGVSARRMLQALADGETDPATLAAMANKQLRATSEQLCDALGACTELNPVYRRLLKMALEELRFIEQHIGLNLTKRWRLCSASIRMPCSAWLKCRAWEWVRHSRLLPKLEPRQPAFLPKSIFLPGSAPVQETKKARECLRATAPPRAITRCAAFSINVPTPRSRSKEASFRSYIADWCPAWDTIKPSGRLPIGSADSSGLFCIAGLAMWNTVLPSKKVRNEHARRE